MLLARQSAYSCQHVTWFTWYKLCQDMAPILTLDQAEQNKQNGKVITNIRQCWYQQDMVPISQYMVKKVDKAPM